MGESNVKFDVAVVWRPDRSVNVTTSWYAPSVREPKDWSDRAAAA